MNFDKKSAKYASYDFKDRHVAGDGNSFIKKVSHKKHRQNDKKMIKEYSNED
jgi:hypothetical protein